MASRWISPISGVLSVVRRSYGRIMLLPADLAKKALEGRVSMACLSRTKAKCAFKLGHDYALQSGKRTLGRLTVLDVKASTTQDLGLQDARKLGFRTRTDFYERWKGQETIWLIRFVMGIHTDEPRLLCAHIGTSEGDYTKTPSRSARGAGEEVSGAFQGRFAAEGEANLALGRQIPRERLIAAVKEILPAPRNAKDRKQMRSIEHHAKQYQA